VSVIIQEGFVDYTSRNSIKRKGMKIEKEGGVIYNWKGRKMKGKREKKGKRSEREKAPYAKW
jgi:hypothetical protein